MIRCLEMLRCCRMALPFAAWLPPKEQRCGMMSAAERARKEFAPLHGAQETSFSRLGSLKGPLAAQVRGAVRQPQ